MPESTPPDHSRLHDALGIVCAFLERHGLSSAVAGGLAVAVWGEPRATFDVDLVVVTAGSTEATLLAAIRSEPMFVLDPQALPMPPAVNIVRAHLLDRCADERSLILVDLLLVPDEFATDLLKRRVELEIGGQHRQVCSAEDLILLKLLAGRSKDLEDIRGIRRIQGDAIDVPYIEIWVDRLRCRENWRLVSS